LAFGRGLAWLRGFWANGSVTPLICRETAGELLDVLNYSKFKLDPAKRSALLEDFMPYAEIVLLPEVPPDLAAACRDVDDEVFVQLALAGAADFLVTGDRDLLALRGAVPVRIVAVNEWKGLLPNTLQN
jgi:putative PIN family toxin of toxin-antitoxin system